MTGTALTEATEFMKIYKLPVVEIPTNQPMVRADKNDQIFKTKGGKWRAVAREIDERHEKGQPVLVGTISVEVSEMLSDELKKRGIPHTVLNAKPEYAEREGEIIAEAGRPGAVTIATNMAGRGVDIKLGGNAEHLTQLELAKLGLRPGDPDYDERFADILPSIEAQVEEDREKVLEAGGLFICGTERHESRRIDNQLRGRSGRQGDPGESRFFLVRRGRPRAPVRRRPHLPHPRPPRPDRRGGRRGADRGEDALEADRERPAQGRGAELPHPQARARVRRRDEPAARDRLPVPRRGAGGPRHGPGRARADRRGASATWSTSTRPATTSRSGTSTALWAQLDQIFQVDFGPTRIDRETVDRDAAQRRLLTEDAAKLYDEREEELGEELMRALERYLLLQIIDQRWREHLYDMDYLREGIHLRGFAQIEPLVAYKNEAFTLFQDLMNTIWSDFARMIFNVEVEVEGEDGNGAGAVRPGDGTGGARQITYSGGWAPSSPARWRPRRRRASATPRPRATRRPCMPAVEQRRVDESEQIGRNDPCWCGSGKKYKKCHGA